MELGGVPGACLLEAVRWKFNGDVEPPTFHGGHTCVAGTRPVEDDLVREAVWLSDSTIWK